MAELAQLKQKVEQLVQGSPLARRLRDIDIQSDADGVQDTFLRIVLSFSGRRRIDDDQVLRLIQDIEDALIPMDDRFPSVRIREAA